MNVRKLFLILLMATFYATGSNAQTASLDGNLDIANFITSSESEILFFDNEGEICFIDFANFNVNINSISLLDKKGKEVFTEEVWDLPVNAIYELNTKDIQKDTNSKINLFSREPTPKGEVFR